MLMNKWKRIYLNAEDGGEGSFSAGVVTEGGVPSEPADTSTEDSVNWGDMAQELVNDDLGVEGDESVVETPEETPSEPAATPAPAATEPVTPPASEPASQPTPVEPVSTPAPEVPMATAEQYTAWRNDRMGQLEQQYALDEASATALLTEPEKVLPKLAAKVHMEVLENAMRAMQAMVPVMVQQISTHTQVETKAKSLFTQVNPDLADPNLEPIIIKLGSAYREVNRTAPPDVAAKAIGNLVRAALGIAAPQQSVPATPAAPAAPAPVVPFTPARGAGGASSPAGVPSNPYEALAMEFLNDDH